MGPCGPGSRILLKAGDTWSGETFAPPSTWHGRFAESVFLNMYNATLAANQAAYIAGTLTPSNSLPTFASFKSLLITAGESSATADADATEYCRTLALEDALYAAHRAAQPASAWIKFSRYGAGANPILDGTSTINFGIDLSGGSALYGGAWEILDVDVKNYLVAAIRAETNTVAPNGIWIHSSTPGASSIDHITGVSFNASTHTLTTPIPGYTHHFTALGIDCVNVPYTFIEGYNVTNTDTPWYNGGSNYSGVYQMNATHSYYLHPYTTFCTRSFVKSCVMDDMCNIGIPSGKAGYIFSVNTDAIFDSNEIKNGLGNAFDSEGQNVNARLWNNNFHDYGSAACLDASTGGANTGTMFVLNTITHCANVGTDTAPNFIQTSPGTLTTDHLLCVQNTIVKSVNQAFVFSAASYPSTKTNTITDVITQGVFGPDNSVS